MHDEQTPHDQYSREKEKHSRDLAVLQKKRSQLGWARLAVFVLTILISYKVFTTTGLIGLLPVVAGIALLLLLVSKDVRNSQKIRNTKTLIQLNEEELQALAHQFMDRDNGSGYSPTEHAYANDLDLFGQASIYQWLNRCSTEQGRRLLADNLLQAPSPSLVQLRQEAAKELSAKLQWRQQWQAHAVQNPLTLSAEKKILTWLQEEETHFLSPLWKTGVLVYSTLALGSAVAAIAGFIAPAVFSMLFLLFLIFSLVLSINAIRPYIQLNSVVKEAATLEALINWMEAGSFTATYLRNLQGNLKPEKGSAVEEIKTLKKILDRFDLRNSIIGFIFLNPFLLWDVRQMIALNRWRSVNRPNLKNWFDTVAEMDVLHTISTVHFNNPEWCFPKFADKHFTFEGTAIGHPLIPATQRVNNDFSLQGTAEVDLITGSNMAGKSTFLRSLGVNAVLAQMGSPVCATNFLLSPVQVVSSMRIADNLAENTSTFYAELKKLRTIIGMVKAHQKVFILLDEILRGTNSFDRHKGAAALIHQLIREDAVAVIATHDVELAQIQSSYPQSITNYHFDVEIEGEELYFDYKLKHGVCKSLNASLLMKKIGIDLS